MSFLYLPSAVLIAQFASGAKHYTSQTNSIKIKHNKLYNPPRYTFTWLIDLGHCYTVPSLIPQVEAFPIWEESIIGAGDVHFSSLLNS